MKLTSPYITILRPINGFMVGLAVLIGYLISLKTLESIILNDLIYGFLTGFFVSSSIMVFNDIIDLPIDRINRPDRPLPSGKIKVRQAFALGTLLGISGITFSYMTGIETFILALGFWIIGILYNLYFKGTPLIGNMIVSLSIAIPFIYGALMTNKGFSDVNTYILAFTAFTINTYREIIKDIADVEGDKEKGLTTLPIKIGRKHAFYVSILYLFSGLLVGWIPLFINTGLNKYVYFTVLLISEYLIIKSFILILKNGLRDEVILKSKNLCIQGMLLGMLAFLLSKLTILIF